MGLFSSKQKTTVGTTISRLIEDDALPNSVSTGIYKYIFEGGDLNDYLLDGLLTGLGTRAEQMYRYAESHYVHGSPSGDVLSSTQGSAQVEALIETLEGAQVVMEYSHYGPPNTLHVGWVKLVADYGYSQESNQLAALTAIKGYPVFLKDMVVVVPEADKDTFELGALAQWGTAARGGVTPQRPNSVGALVGLARPSPVKLDAVATELHVLVTYVWQPTTPVNTPLQTETLTISMAGVDDTKDYFHAKYLVNNVTKYFMYESKAGTYPTLDAVYVDSPVVSGSYFPFTYFRFNKASVITDTSTDAYKTSKKMLKYLGIDYDTVAEAIDENPDIADVEQALLTMSVPAISTDPIENKYLFDYFNNLHLTMGGTVLSSLAVLKGIAEGDEPEQNSIVIKDALFQMALNNRGIYKRMVSGTVGAIGFSTSVYESETVEVLTNGLPINQLMGVHKYRRQVTEGLYEEILVRDLHMTYFIYQGHNSTGDGTNPILLIPLDISITKPYAVSEKEVLYSRSLHLVFNSAVTTSTPWYQTGVFKIVMLAVAVVFTIITSGAGSPAIGAALGIAGTTLLIVTVIVNVIVGMLIAEGIKLFVKLAGIKSGIALAIILVVASIVTGIADIGNKLLDAGKILAERLLFLSSNLVSLVLQQKYVDLKEDYLKFIEESTANTEALDAANKLLEQPVGMEPLIIFGEKPDDFYNRTVHYGNIGMLGIEAISSYVDIALTLPKLNDTLGKESYVLES